jgi:hypothetical protein
MKINDIVLIKYNNTIGRVQKIKETSYRPLYDIKGVDGFLYSNQYGNEIVQINNLNADSIKILNAWLEQLI